MNDLLFREREREGERNSQTDKQANGEVDRLAVSVPVPLL